MGPLAIILLVGIGAQWVAWRLRLPSILLLLLAGFLVGPIFHVVDPDAVLGESLLPFVSIAVALILLEGGLSLRLADLRDGTGKAVRNLILVGGTLTWGLATVAAHYTLGFSWKLALILGAILVVTGPTVIVPLLRHVRPTGKVGSIVRWEGIVGDPFGAILAVLVFQATVVADLGGATTSVLLGLLQSLMVGGVIGVLGAGLLIVMLRRYWVPDFLHSAVALGIGLAAFVFANAMMHEAGLLAVTVMGVVLANQRWVTIEHIVEFKENLRVLLISSLFILLAARLPLERLTGIDGSMFAFVAILIFVVRPAAVAISTMRSGLTWKEKVFVAWMAPRGIVAAAVTSVFALELEAAGEPGADQLVSVVFAVIVVTVSVYGLTAGAIARRLGLAGGAVQGLLLVGAHEWARRIAQALRDAGVDVLLTDTNHREIRKARMAGFRTHFGSILSEEFYEEAPLEGLGRMLALTHNHQVNSLACLHHGPSFGREAVYQLEDTEASGAESDVLPRHLRGRPLFAEGLTYWEIESRFRRGAIVKRTGLTEEFGYTDFQAVYDREGAPAIPLFVVGAGGRVQISCPLTSLEPGPGDTLIALVDPLSEGEE